MLRHFQIADVLVSAPLMEPLPVMETPLAIPMARGSLHLRRMLRHFRIADVLVSAPLMEPLPVMETPLAIPMARGSLHLRPELRSTQ